MAVELLAADGSAEKEMGRGRVSSSSTVKDTVGLDTASASGKRLITFFSEMALFLDHCVVSRS